MVAMTVTPLMVRVFFRLIIGKSFFDSEAVKAVIKSALDGTASRWYLAEILIFSLLTSSPVGDVHRKQCCDDFSQGNCVSQGIVPDVKDCSKLTNK